MSTKPEIRVTLSRDLLSHLEREADERGVSLIWLIAGIVCDTLENTESPGVAPAAFAAC
ncbi:hypothetical protein [Aquisphaera insulae]|uniref:hypothetical protein n=1 Tax=Aquisphaera insulae TaxID=2712864 RepID=UPI0013ECE58D|nr:hypothetical protein [Aquisphaera insulae]